MKIRNEIISQEINILPKYYTAFENLKEINFEKSSYAQNIKYIFEKYDGKKFITLKYIQREYEIKYNKKISLMTISRVLKKHLKFHHRKTILKNPKLSEENYIVMGYMFII